MYIDHNWKRWPETTQEALGLIETLEHNTTNLKKDLMYAERNAYVNDKRSIESNKWQLRVITQRLKNGEYDEHD